METVSNIFKLDKGSEIWQRSLIERQRVRINHTPKYLVTMNRFRNLLGTCKLFLQKKYRKDTK